MEQKEHKIVVLGSASGDFFFMCDRIPSEGETIHSKTVEKSLGGKGANQAVTLGRLGAKVEMLAQLGNDETGHSYVKHFQANNVGTEHVKILEGQDSGQAYIMSLKNGNNAIVIVGGTNQAYDPNMTELDPLWTEAIRKSKILLLQREIPEYVNTIAAKVARDSGTMVILDVGGRDEPFTTELLDYVDILTPNETELVRVLGKEPKNVEDQERLITDFLRHHPRTKLLLKKGEYGSSIFYLEHPETPQTSHVKHAGRPAISFTDFPDFHLVDTTGAGDCFTGSFALEMLESRDYERAMEFSNQVGFLCITKFGAGPSIPYLKDIKEVFGIKGEI